MTWLSVAVVAELLNKDLSTIQKSAKAGGYSSRYIPGKGRGGRVLQIALESLSPEAQALYHGEPPEPDIMQYTDKQRHEAELKAIAVEEYQRSALPPDDFIAAHNARWPDEPINKAQLFRWQRKYKAGDITALIDKRGGHNREQSSIPPEVWEYFNSLYMTQQKLKIQRCYEFTKAEFPDIPHVSAFERKVKQIPIRAIKLYREGPTAYKNTLPFMKRDYASIQSNEIWFADGHTLDVFTKNKVGKPTRYYLTMWFDARSRMPISWELSDKPPDTGVVKDTLRQGIEVCGVPENLYVDNGMEYKSKDGLNRAIPYSLVSRLGITVIRATPYHGQAKTIERFFGTLEDRFGRTFKTYAGKDAINRPENLRRPCSNPDKYLNLYAPSEEEFLAAFENFIEEYCNTPHTGDGMNRRTPREVYYRELTLRKEVSDTKALRLLCGRVEFRKVQRNGVQIKDRAYWHDTLAKHYKEEVMLIYDKENIDEMNIFTLEGKAICVAKPRIKTAFRTTTDEDFREVKRQQKQINRAMREYRPARELDTYQLIAKKQLDEQRYAESGEVPSAEVFNPLITESRKLENMKQQPTVQPHTDEQAQMQDDMLKYLMEG